MKRGRMSFVIFFVLDFIYMLTVTSLYSLFTYYVNYGSFRIFMLVSTLFGFALYYFTVGRVVMLFSDAVVRFLRLIFKYTVAVPLGFVFGILTRIVRYIYKNTLGRVALLIADFICDFKTELIAKSLARDIGLEFRKGGAK